MISLLLVFVLAVGLTAGWMAGRRFSAEGRRRALYLDAIALADDLVKTPDALDLRSRARRILIAHRKAFPEE